MSKWNSTDTAPGTASDIYKSFSDWQLLPFLLPQASSTPAKVDCCSRLKNQLPEDVQVLIPRTFYGKGRGQIFAGMINDVEIERLSWIIQVDPTYNHMYSYKREAEGNLNIDKDDNVTT